MNKVAEQKKDNQNLIIDDASIEDIMLFYIKGGVKWKDLVFKDLLLMKKMNKKVILVMYFFVIAISFFGENEVYSIMSSAFFHFLSVCT